MKGVTLLQRLGGTPLRPPLPLPWLLILLIPLAALALLFFPPLPIHMRRRSSPHLWGEGKGRGEKAMPTRGGASRHFLPLPDRLASLPGLHNLTTLAGRHLLGDRYRGIAPPSALRGLPRGVIPLNRAASSAEPLQPMTPVADLAPSGVSCSQGAGPRCIRLMDNTFQVSSFTDAHGVMQSPKEFFYGYFSVDIRFQKGYTGGINTAFYLIDTVTARNSDPGHAEIDLEFYGARNSTRLLMATNVFAGGKQYLVQYRIPFDGAQRFHNFAISWSSRNIAWFVDGKLFRVLNRRKGFPWPARPMQPMLSVWDTSSWTVLKARYNKGPISSWFRNFQSIGCAANAASPETGCAANGSPAYRWNKPLNMAQLKDYIHMKNRYLINDWGWDKTRQA